MKVRRALEYVAEENKGRLENDSTNLIVKIVADLLII